MKNKIRNTLVILSILFACVLGLICFAGVFSYNSVSAESIAVDEEITDLPEEKMPCNATIDDDFVDDKVLVVMADQQSSGINTIAANTSSSGGALSEFGEVTELTKESSAVLESQSDVATISALGVGNGSVENKIDAEDYKKIFSLTLKESGKQNVLDTIHELEKRDDVLYAGPDYIYTLESEPEPEPVQINETASIASVTANDPLSSNQWAIDSIGLPTMWEKTTGLTRELIPLTPT